MPERSGRECTLGRRRRQTHISVYPADVIVCQNFEVDARILPELGGRSKGRYIDGIDGSMLKDSAA